MYFYIQKLLLFLDLKENFTTFDLFWNVAPVPDVWFHVQWMFVEGEKVWPVQRANPRLPVSQIVTMAARISPWVHILAGLFTQSSKEFGLKNVSN